MKPIVPFSGSLCTYEGLHEWTSHMFERLGWMVLARHHPDSILCYQKGLQHLLSQIQHKKKETTDRDRRRDLQEMAVQVDILHQFVSDHLLLSPSRDVAGPGTETPHPLLISSSSSAIKAGKERGGERKKKNTM